MIDQNFIIELRKALKFRLPVNHSKNYIKHLREKYPRKTLHHIIHRSNTDYLIVPLSMEEHEKRHKNPNLYFHEDLIKALTELFLYLEKIGA